MCADPIGRVDSCYGLMCKLHCLDPRPLDCIARTQPGETKRRLWHEYAQGTEYFQKPYPKLGAVAPVPETSLLHQIRLVVDLELAHALGIQSERRAPDRLDEHGRREPCLV